MTLSAEELEVLGSIELDANKSVRAIIKDTGISWALVHKHLMDLESKGSVRKLPLLNAARLGFAEYVFYFQIIHKQSEGKLIDLLIRSEFVSWLTKLKGEGLYAACLQSKHAAHIANFLDNLLLGFEDKVESYGSLVRRGFSLLGRRHLSSQDFKRIPLSSEIADSPLVLDSVDTKLVEQLSIEQDTSPEKLARQLHIPLIEIKERLQQLFNNHVIMGYIYEIDSKELGLKNYKVLLSAKRMGPKMRHRLHTFSEQSPGIWYLAECFGSCDFELGIEAENEQQLDEFLHTMRKVFNDSIAKEQVFEVERYLKRSNFSF